MSVVQFERTYTAKALSFDDAGFKFKMSGTLDGYADLSIQQMTGENLTYQLTPRGMRQLAADALAVAEDIEKNCLYDRDALLEKSS